MIMPIYIFHRKSGFTPVNFHTDQEAVNCLKEGNDVLKIEFAPTGKIIWESAKKESPDFMVGGINFAFQVGHHVRKNKGYQFDGEIRAAFTTKAGEIRYVVQLISETPGGNGDGMLHIYNEQQLERA